MEQCRELFEYSERKRGVVMDNYLKRFEGIDIDKVREVVENEFKKLNVVELPEIIIERQDFCERVGINIENIDSGVFWEKGKWQIYNDNSDSVLHIPFINLVVDELNRVC